jgi:hypothetical protein
VVVEVGGHVAGSAELTLMPSSKHRREAPVSEIELRELRYFVAVAQN